VIPDLWDLPDLQDRKVSKGSRVEEATLDSQVTRVTLEDKVRLVGLELPEVRDSQELTDLRGILVSLEWQVYVEFEAPRVRQAKVD